MNTARFKFVRVGLVLSASIPAMAAAQEYVPPPIPPVRETVDANGIDLGRGIMIDQVHSVTIGDASNPAMAFARSVASDGSYRDSTSGIVSFTTGGVTVSLAGNTETFTGSGGNYLSDQRTGSTLTLAGGTFTYTLSDGTKATFEYVADRTMYVTGGYAVTSLTRPSGELMTYHYLTIPVCIKMDGGVCEVEATAARLQSITSNLGYQLKLGFSTNVVPTMIQNSRSWLTLNKATVINSTIDYCAPTANTCAFSTAWPSLSMAGSSSFTDSLGRVTTYTFTSGKLTAIKRPGASTPNVTIAYDGTGKVSSVVRDGVTTTYAYADAAGVRTTTVNAAGPEKRIVKVALADMLRTSDENAAGNVTLFEYDGTTKLLTRITAPELNKTEFEYDARGNVKKTTAKPKPGSTLPDIVTQAGYPASDASFPGRCAAGIAPVVCNKPLTATDAKGQVAEYTYDPVHGGVLMATLPAAIVGATRPQTRYAYTSLYAWYKNSGGTLVQAPSPVTRLTSTSQCITGASCSGTADETQQVIAYQAGSGSVGSNLLPASMTARSGNSSVTSTTAMAYDAVGNVTTIDGPLAGAADMTTLRYDLGRQLLGVISPDPDGAGALKRRAQRLTYNVDGHRTWDGDWDDRSRLGSVCLAPAECFDLRRQCAGIKECTLRRRHDLPSRTV